MAGGGIKINNNKIIGGANGKTPVFKIKDGHLYNSYDNGASWYDLGQVKGANGVDGNDGATGAKLVSQELAGQDANGGNIYKQTFDDNTTAYFVAPRGEKGEKGDAGTGSNIEIDSELSLESENAVQNKVVTEALNKKLEEEDLTEYVKNTDYATASKAGLVKSSATYGLYIGGQGLLTIRGASTDDIDKKVETYRCISPKVLDYAIMKGLTDPIQHTWTDPQKELARATLGVKGVWKHELDISEEDWQNEDGDYIITTSVKLIVLTSGDVELNKDNLKTYIEKGLVAVKNPYYNDPNAPFTLLNLSDNSLWWSGTNAIYFNFYYINNASGDSTLQELACRINLNNAIITDTKTQL